MRECSSPFASSVWGIPALTAAQGGTPEIPAAYWANLGTYYAET
jgi:hypothetical protein